MKKILSIIIVAVFSIASVQAAFAESATATEAEELQSMISNQMNDIRDMYGNMPDVDVDYEGDVSVTPQDSYYKILLPKISLSLSNPNNPADALNIHLKSIGINASKQGDDAWSMSIAIPMPIKATDGNDKTIFNINIGQQRASLFFVPSLLTATKYSFSYKDITVDDMTGTDLKISMDELASNLTLNDNGQGLWSGPATLILKNIAAISDELSINVGNLKMDASYTDLDLSISASFYKKIMDLSASAGTIPGEEVISSINDSFSQLVQSIGGMSTDMSMNDFNASYPNPKTGKKSGNSIGHLSFGFSAQNLRTDVAEFDLHTSLNGIKMQGMGDDMLGLVPDEAETKVRIINFPIQSLFKEYQKLLTEKGHHPAVTNLNALSIMTEAGTKIVLDKNNINTPELGMTSYGEFSANSDAVLKAIGDFTMKLRNLDATIAKYTQSDSVAPMIKQMAGFATMLQAMGSQETTADGQPVRSYHIELTADGKVLLNGNDMSAMVGLAPPSPQ